MRYNNIGINVDSIDKLILDIYNYAEKISTTFDQISDVVSETKEFYVCSSATKYRNKFRDFRVNFKTVKHNINSYAEDLIKLKNRYQNINEDLTRKIKQATIKMENNGNKW